jgi:hypothetical protein
MKQRIMRRVHVVYLIRQLFSGTALRLYALAVLTFGLLRTVSIYDILANMPQQGLLALYDFVTYATLHTELVVQLMLIGATVVGLWLVRDAIRSILHAAPLRRTS